MNSETRHCTSMENEPVFKVAVIFIARSQALRALEGETLTPSLDAVEVGESEKLKNLAASLFIHGIFLDRLFFSAIFRF